MYNRQKTSEAEPAYFPVRGHKTMAEIDDLLVDCGVFVSVGNSALDRRYRRLRDRTLSIILKEIRADRNGGKDCD